MATPLKHSSPLAGNVLILTAAKMLAGLSFASAKPKSAAVKVLVPSSDTVTVASKPVGASLTGASLTGVTLTVMVLALGSRSTPPLAVPPLSRTWKVKLA